MKKLIFGLAIFFCTKIAYSQEKQILPIVLDTNQNKSDSPIIAAGQYLKQATKNKTAIPILLAFGAGSAIAMPGAYGLGIAVICATVAGICYICEIYYTHRAAMMLLSFKTKKKR